MLHLKHMRRRKFFALLDFVVVLISIAIALYIRKNFQIPGFQGLLKMETPPGFDSFLLPSLSLGFIFIFTQYVTGVYDLWYTASISLWAQRLLPTNSLLIGISFSYLYIAQNFTFPRSLLIVIFVVNYITSILWRAFYFRQASSEISDVVVIGNQQDVLNIVKELETPPYNNYISISALVLLDEEKEGCKEVPARQQDFKYTVLSLKNFDDFSKSHPYTSIILVPTGSMHEQTFGFILGAARQGISIYTVPSIYEILLGRLHYVRINDLPLLEIRLEPPSLLTISFKRCYDVLLALCGLVVASVPMLLIALFIKLCSPGPIFYTQMRVGKDNRLFKIYKFRSMVADAEKTVGIVQATKNDPRVTSIGKFLRVTRFDELPQLINILIGDMSFVGPRPLVPKEVEKFEQEYVGFKERLRVRPGLTGLAQVSGTYVTSPDIKLKYDLAYIANQNLMFDLQILFRTLKTVLTRAGQ